MASNINISTVCQNNTHLEQGLSDQMSNSGDKDYLKTDKFIGDLASDSEQSSNPVTTNIDNNEIINNEDEKLKEEKFHLELDKLNVELQIKPAHWTDEYWKDILTKYPWFLHKDDHVGCKICYNVKVFVGKKSLLSTMKLFIMDLSYDEFEQKLRFHNSTNQHSKCEEYFKQSFNLYAKKEEEVVHLKTFTTLLNESKSTEYNCPQCYKNYKFKKALATHLHICDPKFQQSVHYIPCKCPIQNIYSLCSFDQHVSNVHADKYRYMCHICSLELSKTADLFEHLFLKHDYFWDPYNEFPQVKLRGEIINLSNMGTDMNKTSSFSSRYSDAVNSSVNNLENRRFDPVDGNTPLTGKCGIKRVFKEISQSKPSSFKKPMQEMTNFSPSNSFTIDLNMIVVCPICEGRYLSETVLKSHMDRYHPK